MHVGLLIDGPDDRLGDAPDTMELAGALAARGLTVTVLSAGAAPAGRSPEGCRVVASLAGDRAAAGLPAAVGKAVADGGIDLLHSLGPRVDCDLYQPRSGTQAERRARVLAMPRPWLARMKLKWRMRFGRRERAAADRERAYFARRPHPMIVANSPYTARQLWHHYGLEDGVHTVSGGVRGPTLSAAELAQQRQKVRLKLELPEQTTALLLAADDLAWAGAGWLIDAMALAERQGGGRRRGPMALVVAGRGDAGPYRERAAAMDLSASIRDLAELAEPQWWGAYAAADVAVLPTVGTACSRVVLEALSAGTPAITTEHSGAARLIDRAGAGEVVHSPWAVAELAAALGRACDPAVRGGWARAAVGLAKQVSIGRMADELIAVYEQVAKAKKGV